MIDKKLIIKRYNTRTAIKAFLKTPKGNPVNLSNAVVHFIMVKSSTNSLIINREAIVTDPTNGTVCFIFDKEEMGLLGSMLAEFKVTYSSGEIETFPNSGYIQIYFEKELV